MKWNLIAIFALGAAAPAFAEEPEASAPAKDPAQVTPQEKVRQALEERVEAPKTPPTLPDQASDRARYVHENIAFGKKGAEMREANAEAKEHGLDRAREVGDQEHKGRGMDSAEAQRGNADRMRATGRARSQEAAGTPGMNLPGPAGGGAGYGGSGGHPAR